MTMFARRRDELERESNRLGALAVRGDVTNAADLERLVERTVQAFGGVDVLVWNSGGPPPGSAAEITDERLEAAFELLLRPAVRLVRLCLPHLRASEAGRVHLHHLGRGQGADAEPRALEHDPSRGHRLGEDAFARARA